MTPSAILPTALSSFTITVSTIFVTMATTMLLLLGCNDVADNGVVCLEKINITYVDSIAVPDVQYVLKETRFKKYPQKTYPEIVDVTIETKTASDLRYILFHSPCDN